MSFFLLPRPVVYAAGLWLLMLATTARSFAADPVEFEVGAFLFERPAELSWVTPTSPMRKAELRIPNPDPAQPPVEVTFFHFGAGQGGSPESNLQRWLSQFQEPPEVLNAHTAEQTFGTTKVLMLSAKGTFLSGMPGQPTTPQPDTEMRAAILTNPGGDVYVKMTGPGALVRPVAESFDKMILDAAARPANPENAADSSIPAVPPAR